MADLSKMKPGDLLEYRCPRFGIVWQWRVISICIGAQRQESLIEVAPVMANPGYDTEGQKRPTTWVPEPMTRNLTLVEIDNG